MYIKKTRAFYDSYGGQHAGRQWFLILVQTEGRNHDIRAIVRKVALEQLGHWMMGTARAFNESITISGSYGSDGLPKTVSKNIYDNALPLPQYLYDAWKVGGGHNSAGNEAPLMRQWALENFDKLAPKNAQL